MEPSDRPRPDCTEAQPGDGERQEALAGLPAIALHDEEASRFLKALEQPDDRTVARLAELRRRA
jgi:hypothetical protein